jgi:Fis family transcriptional regulator, factor for inversion stimulation protein
MTKVNNESPLKNSVRQAIQHYFDKLDGGHAANIYDMFITEIEVPLLETVLQQTNGNKSLAAKWLGISRNTLKKLLDKHAL